MYKSFFILLILILAGCSGNRNRNNQTDPKQKSALAENLAKSENVQSNPSMADKDAEAVEGMVLIKGGSILIGSDEGMPNERPVHRVSIESFYMDRTPVTVEMFSKFIQATGFKTDAEKFGDAGVFDLSLGKWELVKGATWQYPFGPAGPKAENNHPVTQVSWNDAMAYAAWAGKRLPSEAEWEFAARSGRNSGNRFSWGNELQVDGKYKANTWQGAITEKRAEDGFLFTSPVGYYGFNEAGLADMGGNVWNWCSDIFVPYPGNGEPFQVNNDIKCIRGGSFFYDQNGEYSFTVSGRSMNSRETSLFNTGFRCAKNK